MRLLAGSLVVLLTGCATPYFSTAGMAGYRLQSGDCDATVYSGRNVAEAQIEGCGLKVTVKGLTGQEAQLKTLELLDRAIP